MAKLRRLLSEMAWTRRELKNRLEEKLIGALIEYYKAEYAILNGQTKWVTHWRREVNDLLLGFEATLLHSTKGCRDKIKAANEVIPDLQARDDSFRTVAANTVVRDYGLKKVTKHPSGATTKRFWERIQKILELHEQKRG